MDEKPLRDFADRFFRDALRNPENLRDFLSDAVPKMAPNFDFTRTHLVKSDFLLPNWCRREADLLFEIPYRFDEGERLALVCVLIEHQTRPDSRMPLRTLLEVALYWDRQLQAWENAEQPKGDFRLTSVLPIVLYAGDKPWGSARTIAAMLGPPPAFHPFAPVWEPVFWELAKHSAEELLNAEAAFVQVLAIVRMENEERAEFERVFQETFRRLDSVRETRRVHWAEMIKLIFGWVFHRRPQTERQQWSDLAAQTQEGELHQQELRTMAQTVGKTIFDEGQEEKARSVLLRLEKIRFKEPDLATLVAIRAVEDLDRLDRMTDRILSASSWAEILETD